MQYTTKTAAGITVTITDYTSTLPREQAPIMSGYRMTKTGPIAQLNGVWYSVNGAPERGWIETRYPLDKNELNKLNLY
jgi:hypothetical protein